MRTHHRTIAAILAAVTTTGALALSPPAAGTTPPPAPNSTAVRVGLGQSDDTVVPGGAATVRAHLVVDADFPNNVALEALGLPDGVTATFDINPIPVPAGVRHSQLTLQTSATTPFGRFPITVRGTTVPNTPGQPTGHSDATFQLIVAPVDAPSSQGETGRYTLLSGQTSGTAIAGGATFGTTAASGYLVRRPNVQDAIQLSASGLPAGVTAEIAQGSSTWLARFTPSSNSPLGTFPVTVTSVSIPQYGSQTYTATMRFFLTIAAPPGFTATVAPAAGVLARGGQVTTTLSLTAVPGLPDAATVTVTGAPIGVSTALSAVTVASAHPVTLTLSASLAAPAGTFPIGIRVANPVNAQLTQFLTYQLTIPAVPSYEITLDPSFATVTPGGTASTVVSLIPVNGYADATLLRVAGAPDWLSVTFSAPTVSDGAPVTMTVTAARDAPSGSIHLRVEAADKPLAPARDTQLFDLTITDPIA